MKRWIWVVAAAGLVSACATTDNALIHSAFDYPTPRTAPAQAEFGYSMAGADGWSGSIGHRVSGGESLIDLALQSGGGGGVRAELDFGEGYLRDGVRRYDGVASDGAAVEVVLQAGLCAVAGESYAYFVEIAAGSARWTGCAREAGARDRWSNYLSAYLPAIDLCLAEMGRAADHVTIAYPMGAGTAVRIVDRDGRRWECVTRAEDTRLGSLRMIDAAEVILDEGDPIFVRGAPPRAGEGCYVYEIVRTATGEAVGAFGYDSCLTPAGERVG